MSKSNGRGLFGRKSGSTVTVIEDRVYRSTARNAKLAFFLTLFGVGLLAATIAGPLPFIGLAIPTLVGERVWICLRPGLSRADLEGRLDKLAVACYAATVTVTKASESNAAWVRLDIKRRNPLTGKVAAPLV